MYMGDTDPFVCLQCLSKQARYPARSHGRILGNVPVVPHGNRVGVALSYLTPDAQWHTIWRTLANPGE